MNTQIVPIERAEDGALIVSSLTIAEGSGVQHKNVLELIINNAADLEEFGHLAFETRPGYNNATVRIALLNEHQATLVMTYQRNTEKVKAFKFALVKAFFEMAKQLLAPRRELTFEEKMAEVMGTLNQRIADQHAALAIAAPKADAFDALLSTTGDYSVNEAAKVLARDEQIHIGEGRLRALLEEWKWMYRQSGRPRAMQTQIDTGRLAEKAQFHYHPESGEKVLDCPQVRVTAKGVSAIRERLLRQREDAAIAA